MLKNVTKIKLSKAFHLFSSELFNFQTGSASWSKKMHYSTSVKSIHILYKHLMKFYMKCWILKLTALKTSLVHWIFPALRMTAGFCATIIITGSICWILMGNEYQFNRHVSSYNWSNPLLDLSPNSQKM